MEQLVAPTINLVILLSILVYYLRAPLKQFIYTRHLNLRDELAAVRTQLTDAQTRYAEFSSKLNAIDAEISALKAEAKQDAQALKARIATETQKSAANIVSDARSSAQALFGDLRTRLARELGGAVLDRAEALLRERLTGDDRARIRQEFSQQVETVQ